MFNKGPTLIILKTNQGAICGGFTSKNWDGSNKWTEDNDAFVFNMTQRYNCNNISKAIDPPKNGFKFGYWMLALRSDSVLNQQNQGWCYTGKGNYYDIEKADVSPLTNQNNNFTCAQLEVYKLIFN